MTICLFGEAGFIQSQRAIFSVTLDRIIRCIKCSCCLDLSCCSFPLMESKFMRDVCISKSDRRWNMMRTEDITGMRFGRLVVITRTAGKDTKQSYWLCKCDCGNEKVATGYNLRNGHTRSCGCLMVESSITNMKKAHVARRKHFGCLYCGSDKHYAKGYCRSCYMKARRDTLE